MSASAPLLVKKAIYTVSKDKKLPGILTVTGSHIQWTPHDPTESQPQQVDIKCVTGAPTRPHACKSTTHARDMMRACRTSAAGIISGQTCNIQKLCYQKNACAESLQRAKGRPLLRVPTKERPLVFQFETEADRDQAVDIITPLVKSAQDKGKGLANGNPASAKPASGPHAELKKAVLAANRFC